MTQPVNPKAEEVRQGLVTAKDQAMGEISGYETGSLIPASNVKYAKETSDARANYIDWLRSELSASEQLAPDAHSRVAQRERVRLSEIIKALDKAE